MPKPEETSKPKKTPRVSRVMTILPRPSPTENLGERSAPPTTQVNSNFPKGRIVTPVAAAPDSGGGSVSEALSNSFAPVVPVKLWRNPYASVRDVPPAPMIRVNKPSTLQHPLGQLEANLGRPSTLLVNNESSMHSTAGRNDDTILVVKKMQNGRTVITAQPAKSGSKGPSCGDMSQECSPCHVGGALTKVTASTVKLTTPVNNFVKITANAPKMAVTESHLSAAAIPTVKSQGSSRESSSQTTGKVAKCSTSVQSRHSPAVVRITPMQGSTMGKTLVVPSQGTTMPISPAMSRSDVSPTASSKPVDVGRPAGKQERVAGGVQDVNEMTQAIGFASGQQQDEDGCGIKISDVISLAGKEGLTFPELAVPQETEENESPDASNTKSGGETYKKPDTNGDEETNSKLEMPPLSSCMLSVGANESDEDVIELCSFQAKTGNSVIGSQIVFKPAPVQGNASRSTYPSSKVDMLNKLKEAIKVLEEPTLQDCNLFTEKEKSWLTSLLHRVEKDARVSEARKRDEQCSGGRNVVVAKIKTEPGVSTDTLPIKPYQRDTEQGSSGLNMVDAGKVQGKSLEVNRNIKIKTEPGISPDTVALKAYQEVPQQVSSSFNTTYADKVHLKSSHDHSRGVNAKTRPEPESLHHSVPSAKNEDTTVQQESISHKPLRRIVITSDELPSLSSDEVKNGLEAFLVKNNISNNFSKDEIIKLHWDGKDVSTFHFRDIDSEELQQPPIGTVKTNRPSILRPVKVPQPAGGIGTEPFTTATETNSKETVSEPVLSQAEKVVEELMVPIDGSAVPAGFKAVKLNCRTDTGEVVQRVVLKSMKPIRVINSTTHPEKQIGFLPRVIRFIKQTGEITDKPVNPHQQIMPFLASAQAANKSTPVCTANVPIQSTPRTYSSRLTSLIKSPAAAAAAIVPAESVKHFLSKMVTNTMASNSLIKQPKLIALSSAPTAGCPGSTMPITASKVVRVKRTPSVPLGPQSSQAVLPESAVRLQADLAPPIASKPESSAEAEVAERIFEPECLLEESNNTLEVAPLKTGGLNDDSLSDTSSTSSSDASGDFVPPVVNRKKEQPPAPKRSPPKRSTVLREYRTRRRKRQCRKQDPRVVAPSAKRNASSKNDSINVAMMSSNCIDRPCVVSMYHLNDQVLANGFVNLTTVKHEDLFLLASSPVVRLSSDKLVSVVELKPQASDTLQQSAEVSSITDTDNLERLLKEQQNQLVQLRKKYKKLSP
ncbi:mucin-17-like [Dermacentor silvarum]|uniref:mucin-17-like n=1 Tax=Dermacentor silvarum TaxID=543639 RepID=UPI00189A749F|nr:mucin-17-like [Dermacentor silvarum]